MISHQNLLIKIYSHNNYYRQLYENCSIRAGECTKYFFSGSSKSPHEDEHLNTVDEMKFLFGHNHYVCDLFMKHSCWKKVNV